MRDYRMSIRNYRMSKRMMWIIYLISSLVLIVVFCQTERSQLMFEEEKEAIPALCFATYSIFVLLATIIIPQNSKLKRFVTLLLIISNIVYFVYILINLQSTHGELSYLLFFIYLFGIVEILFVFLIIIICSLIGIIYIVKSLFYLVKFCCNYVMKGKMEL